MYQEVQNGEFQVLDAFETLEEMKIILENISLDDLKFVGVHASNYLPLQGTLPRDKQKMLDTVELVLNTRNHSYLRAESMRGLGRSSTAAAFATIFRRDGPAGQRS